MAKIDSIKKTTFLWLEFSKHQSCYLKIIRGMDMLEVLFNSKIENLLIFKFLNGEGHARTPPIHLHLGGGAEYDLVSAD